MSRAQRVQTVAEAPKLLRNRSYGIDCLRLVGATRFELATPCTPCKCATRLRHAPTEEVNDSRIRGRELESLLVSATQNFDQFFKFQAHLMNQLLALIEIHLGIIPGQSIAGSANRKALFI
jgi:hypothetical protein